MPWYNVWRRDKEPRVPPEREWQDAYARVAAERDRLLVDQQALVTAKDQAYAGYVELQKQIERAIAVLKGDV